MKTIISVVAAFMLALALATSAAAQSSVDGYNDQGGQVQVGVGGGDGDRQGPAAVTVDEGDGGAGGLPFTGLDVALLLAAGGVLTGAGFAMRRLARAPGSA